jgi:hypothetical protein
MGLLESARQGDLLSVQRLLAEGASITESDSSGMTALLLGAAYGHLRTVQFLLAAGARITEKDGLGRTALLLGARSDLGMVRWLLIDGGARITEMDRRGEDVWSLLKLRGVNTTELSSLLQVMVLLDDAPADFITKLSPLNAVLTTRGRELRAMLPLYLEQQQTLISTHFALPSVLLSIVLSYAAPTQNELWTDGLSLLRPSLRPRRKQYTPVSTCIPCHSFVEFARRIRGRGRLLV